MLLAKTKQLVALSMAAICSPEYLTYGQGSHNIIIIVEPLDMQGGSKVYTTPNFKPSHWVPACTASTSQEMEGLVKISVSWTTEDLFQIIITTSPATSTMQYEYLNRLISVAINYPRIIILLLNYYNTLFLYTTNSGVYGGISHCESSINWI